jgi:VanZ family protein
MPMPPLPHRLIASPLARRAWRVLLVLLLLAVGYLAIAPAPPDGVDLGWDKANHLLAFSALTVAACFGFPGTPRRVAGIAAAQLAFGALIELVQASIPGRDAEWSDLLADSVGIAVGCLVASWTLRSLLVPARHSRTR